MLLERLSIQTGRSAEQLLSFATSAGIKYKVFTIPKRSGGVRVIEQPSKSVKAVQRWLVKALFSKYPVHPSAMGYRERISVRNNASIHVGFRFTLRVDFKDFFWSFCSDSIENFFRFTHVDGVSLSDKDIKFISGVVSRDNRLVMGAPSSPSLTNIMMFGIDSELSKMARENNAAYTRYADDLFFSSNFHGGLDDILENVEQFIDNTICPRLFLNREKTLFLSRKYRRTVTGLVLTPQGDVSLGRARKRMIKALVHQGLVGNLDGEAHGRLAGFLNWAASADPTFLQALNRKYSPGVIEKFRRCEMIERAKS